MFNVQRHNSTAYTASQHTAIRQYSRSADGARKPTSCTLHVDLFCLAVRSKLAEGIDPFLLSCWACLSHDVLTVCKRHTNLTVSDLVKFIETEAESLCQTAKDHAATNVDAEIPVSLCPANLLYKVLLSKRPDCVLPDPPCPAKRPASAADVGATEDVEEDGRDDEELEVGDKTVGSATTVDSAASVGSHKKRWRSRALNESIQATSATSSEGRVREKKARTKSATEAAPKRRIAKKSPATSSQGSPKPRVAAKAKAKAKAKIQ